MKHIICATILALILSSCSSTFYYSTLNTTDDFVEKVDNGDFLLETDSLWIAYCFKGESAPIQITVFNKTDKALYIDWHKSALILNNTAYSYAGDKYTFSGDGQIFNDAGTYFDGSMNVPPQTTFIPPKTMVRHMPLKLEMNFENLNKKIFKDGYIGDKDNQAIKLKKTEFDITNTPLFFKSYLTIYQDLAKPMTFEQSFYISNLMKTGSLKPKNLPESIGERGDFFYVEKPANNTFWEVLLGTTIVVGVVALSTTVDTDYNYYE